jgi:hypothetical protein
MRAIRNYVFYGTMVLYALYNSFWITGTMFSFGKNDTRAELILFTLIFVADVPVFLWAKANIGYGSLCFIAVLTLSLYLARSEHVLNRFTALYWYGPKLIPWLATAWAFDPHAA